MTNEELAIAAAWKVAGEELGIRVISPYELQTTDGGTYSFIGLVEGFGSSKGTLLSLPHQWDDLGFADVAEENGYYCSGLYPQSYIQFDRESFIDTLNDWGWFSVDESRPFWLVAEDGDLKGGN